MGTERLDHMIEMLIGSINGLKVDIGDIRVDLGDVKGRMENTERSRSVSQGSRATHRVKGMYLEKEK